ncbi:hypothetical protein P43SY_006300 [Pythium insidiosum]|uniref:Uncharacterized protein n=1 Tax=Pythium insidiosum TaxID=114742 RepID=A0AAD5Q7T0_PYTIN|nr:hypothetical protein P43SY_006300 [Pythium insidiosum]
MADKEATEAVGGDGIARDESGVVANERQHGGYPDEEGVIVRDEEDEEERQQFRELFVATGPEMDALLKDTFWYLTAHIFQPGRHEQLEECFYERIADTFASLFIRTQFGRNVSAAAEAPININDLKSTTTSPFLDTLPDVLAQILFMALYEAFPKSRKHMVTTDLRERILRLCYCWIVGFVPADLDTSHWLSVDQESPKRIAALADFPAMRNRMLRAERIERTKIEVRNRHHSLLSASDEEPDGSDEEGHERPDAHSAKHESAPPGARSPRGTSSLPPLSGRRISAAQEKKSSAGVSSSSQQHTEIRERSVYQMRNSPLIEAFLKRHNLDANATHLKRELDAEFGELRHNSTKLRETSNMIASRGRIDTARAKDNALRSPSGVTTRMPNNLGASR